MSGYTKLFSSIVGSTIWREDSDTRVVWMTMLALADQDGIVESSIPGLADLARVSVDRTKAALAKFMSPDEYSRTPDYEGRRIEPVDGGWRLLNHAKYRFKLSKEDIRERDRLRKQRYRDQQKLACPTQCGTKRDNPEISADSNIQTQIQKQKKIQHTQPTGIEATRVCVHISLSGSKNRQAILAVIESEMTRTLRGAEEIADRMISSWTRYKETPDKPFEYSSPVAFFRDGCWLRPESWKPPAKEAKRERSLMERLDEQEGIKPAYVPRETDEECEERIKRENRERRERDAAAKAIVATVTPIGS